MNKLIILCLLTLSCGGLSKSVAGLTGYDKFCIQGVVYYQFTSGASVGYNPDGSVKTCN